MVAAVEAVAGVGAETEEADAVVEVKAVDTIQRGMWLVLNQR